MQLKDVHIIDIVVICVLGLAPVACRRASAQTFAPYSDFQAMSQSDLETLQVKLTYAGNQLAGTRSLLFTPQGNTPTIALFIPYRRSQILYVNDDDPPLTFAATTQQLKAMIDNVATVSSVIDGDVDPDGYVSFAMLNTAGGTTKVFEAVVNDTTGPLLMAQVLTAFQANQAGLRLLTQAGCHAEILPANAPGSLEGQVHISFSGLRRDRTSGKVFVGRARVTNTSGATIQGPLSLVVVRTGDAEFLDETGFTCNIHPPGFPYVDLPLGNGLTSGASVEKVLRFNNPSLDKFNVRFRAFAGPGTR